MTNSCHDMRHFKVQTNLRIGKIKMHFSPKSGLGLTSLESEVAGTGGTTAQNHQI